MSKRMMVLGLMAGAVALGGCVSQQAYDDTERSARTFEARNQELLDENAQLEAMVSAKDARIRELEGEKSDLERRVGGLSGDLTSVRGAVGDLDEQLRSLRFGGVNPATDRRLRELASKYPSLVEYDPSRGMLRLGSDLTFGSGSDQLQASAAGSLRELAGILNSGDASAYDIHVVGHTDSQQPGRSAARHPTNRHLAAHRAIAVARALESAGVKGNRILVAGWGEFRPAVANNARGGTKANRRVELYLLPTTANDAMTVDAAASAPDDAPATERRRVPIK